MGRGFLGFTILRLLDLLFGVFKIICGFMVYYSLCLSRGSMVLYVLVCCELVSAEALGLNF